MKTFLNCLAALALASAASGIHAASNDEIVLHGASTLQPWRVMVAGPGGAEQALEGGAVTIPKPAGSHAPGAAVGARAGDEAGMRNALTLQWKDAWVASLRFDGGASLDLRDYTAGGTVAFDINVADLEQGGIYFVMRCGPECYRKLPFVLPGRKLQGKGWQRLSFSMACFARAQDDFSRVPLPFSLEANGSGQVALANIRFVKRGKPNTPCPDYLAQSVTPEPLSHAWALANWPKRHLQKLDENRKLLAAGKNPKIVFIGDSITEGWEHAGQAVWQRYYAKHDAVALGFGGDHTENVLWRLQHGEVDGLAPKVAVLMIGTNNAGDRNDDPQATAAGIKAIIGELRRRLPGTKVLLLAIFPREQLPDAFLRRLNEQVNARIAGLADGRHVFFANINESLLNADGTLSREVMPDLLHLHERGYETWARSIAPILQELLAE
ncbi:MAG: 1,4-beta-D-glucan glucohydrolase [Pseudoduganella sp.]|jgi:lysophospholipase L1-like esterase|nr:1,4-beta-D-glucan glucohydrolase [Pseudoduganella sp.]